MLRCMRHECIRSGECLPTALVLALIGDVQVVHLHVPVQGADRLEPLRAIGHIADEK